MLVTAFALVVLAAACAVVLLGQHTDTRLQFVPTVGETSATADAWRAAALDAHTHAKRLRHGISSALDSRDAHEREAILRDALADTWRPGALRIDL